MIKSLTIRHFRNLSHTQLDANQRFNFIIGPNGAGKTSVLEAVSYFSLGRSFRTSRFERVIQHEQASFTLFAELFDDKPSPVGYEKKRDGVSKVRIAGRDAKGVAELSSLLPTQLITPSSFQLLTEGPTLRRKFLDWGVFHVEPGFHNAWQRYQRALKQRNSLLKQQEVKPEFLLVWNKELVETGEQIDRFRTDYLNNFLKVFQEILPLLLPQEIKVSYQRGWAADFGLADALKRSFGSDLKMGYTGVGCHRADLQFLVDRVPAHEVLSRGQQKLLVIALSLAQGQLLLEQTQKSSIYLIDDFPSELDPANRMRVFELLQKLNSQVFITGIEESAFAAFLEKEPESGVFHVEPVTAE